MAQCRRRRHRFIRHAPRRTGGTPRVGSARHSTREEIETMAQADVVVIGGGANGTSTAFQLARLGVKNVTLVERRQLAAGATGKSGSLVRMHYTNEIESRLA